MAVFRSSLEEVRILSATLGGAREKNKKRIKKSGTRLAKSLCRVCGGGFSQKVENPFTRQIRINNYVVLEGPSRSCVALLTKTRVGPDLGTKRSSRAKVNTSFLDSTNFRTCTSTDEYEYVYMVESSSNRKGGK